MIITDQSRDIDTGVTGIPLVSEFLAQSGAVPRLKVQERLTASNVIAADPVSSQLWSALKLHSVAEYSVCFALNPFLQRGIESADPTAQAVYSMQLVRWYNPKMAVVAFGSRAGEVLDRLRIGHSKVLAPNQVGASIGDQFRQIIEERRVA